MYILYYETNYMENPEALPSPREVDTFISVKHQRLRLQLVSFRPLSRWIGLYPGDEEMAKKNLTKFPSPLEVNRFISIRMQTLTVSSKCFRPLPRYIGFYRTIFHLTAFVSAIVSVPSRGI